ARPRRQSQVAEGRHRACSCYTDSEIATSKAWIREGPSGLGIDQPKLPSELQLECTERGYAARDRIARREKARLGFTLGARSASRSAWHATVRGRVQRGWRAVPRRPVRVRCE